MKDSSHLNRISFFLPSLAGGGAEKVVINMLKGMSAKDIPLDIVLADATGPYMKQIPTGVRVIDLKAGRIMKSIWPLARYIRQENPIALISHMSHANIAAIMANKLSFKKTKIVVVEHIGYSHQEGRNTVRGKLIRLFIHLLYREASAVIAVSEGVAKTYQGFHERIKSKTRVIYNPVISDATLDKSKAEPDHPWFKNDACPVFLAAGRLTPQKDYITLLKAFKLLLERKSARLIILGEGESQGELEDLIRKLNISAHVSMPGFADNPYAYMRRAAAFVLSSRYEGLPTVLIEALGCGCPVIATDCPSGPAEILEGGKYGTLVPIGDVSSLSGAMLKILENHPFKKELLEQRARDFSIEKAVSEYLALISYQSLI